MVVGRGSNLVWGDPLEAVGQRPRRLGVGGSGVGAGEAVTLPWGQEEALPGLAVDWFGLVGR